MNLNNLDIILNNLMNHYYSKWNQPESIGGGKNADYISILGDMDPNILQVTIISIDNPKKKPIIVSKYMSSKYKSPLNFNSSDNTNTNNPEMVSIQSISKVFTLGLALKKHSIEFMKNYIGTEQSFAMFNSKDAIKIVPYEETGIPFTINPFVNAGAITTTSLITKKSGKEPFEQITDNLKLFGSLKNIKISKATYQSEMMDLENNTKLVYLLKLLSMCNKTKKEHCNQAVYKNIQKSQKISEIRSCIRKKINKKSCKKIKKSKFISNNKTHRKLGTTPNYFQGTNLSLCPELALSTYTAQCSVLVNSDILARMAFPLLNNGINLDGKVIFKDPCIPNYIINTMLFAGMYNASGTWFQNCGIPAKSGVGGGIIGIVPNKCVIAVVSPPLDKYGNSYLGTLIFEYLSKKLGLNILNNCSGKDIPYPGPKSKPKPNIIDENFIGPDIVPVSPIQLIPNIEKCLHKLKDISKTNIYN